MKKYKLKDKTLPVWDSYCGLDYYVWQKLNAGQTVQLDKVPTAAEEYLTEVKLETKVKKEAK